MMVGGWRTVAGIPPPPLPAKHNIDLPLGTKGNRS